MEEIVDVISSHEETLVDLDDSYKCDVLFLKQHAVPKLKRMADAMVLACFPSQGEDIPFKTTLERIGTLMADARIIACGQKYGEDLKGIYDMVHYLQLGFPPKSKAILSFSPLAKLAVLRSENFCTSTKAILDKSGKPKAAKAEALKGPPAIKHIYQAVLNNGGCECVVADPERIKPLKQFMWMLDPPMQTNVTKWLNKLGSKGFGVAKPALGDLSTLGACVGGSSKDALAMVGKMPIFTEDLDTKKAAAKGLDAKASLVNKFFAAKGKSQVSARN